LTKNERSVLEEFTARWKVAKALLVRRVIQYFIESGLSLPEFLEKYRAPGVVYRTAERRVCRVSVRLMPGEKNTLDILAYKGFYLPGEAARILMTLYLTGVISDDAI
jgi:hypothetical protein